MRLILSIFLIFLSSAAAATESVTASDTFLSTEQISNHKATISRVEKYLTGLTTIVSDFTQVAPDGSLTTGKFYMQRPGMMRWQYNPPTPVLMVADGKILTFYDYELQQVNYIKLDSTVIGFLAREKISFDKDVGLLNVEHQNHIIRIQLAQKDKIEDGSLTLEFSDNPLQIRNMVVMDATGQVTTVSLNHARYGVKLAKELFQFKDPRKPQLR